MLPVTRYFNDFPGSTQLNRTGYAPRLGESQRFGAILERWAADHLTGLGYHCQLMPDWNHQFDILIDGFLPCEVKAARPTTQRRYNGRAPRQRWQFCTQSKLRKQDYIFILVAIDSDGVLHPFVIPSAFIGTRQFISITSHPESYSGWVAEHLSAWQWVETVYHWRQKYQANEAGQMPLPLFDSVYAEVAQ